MGLEKIKISIKRCLGFIKYYFFRRNAVLVSNNSAEQETEVVVVIAAHGRLDLLFNVIQSFLNYGEKANSEKLFPKVYLSLVVCVSTSRDSNALLDHFRNNPRLHVLACHNKPLGNKWQQAVLYARKLNPKALLICGSDDLVSETYFNTCMNQIRLDESYLCAPNKWHVLEGAGHIYELNYKTSVGNKVLGSGRVYNRTFLDKINWSLFDKYLDSGLDYRGTALVNSVAGKQFSIVDSDFSVLSIKGDWEMLNTFETLRSSNIVDVNIVKNINNERIKKEFGLE